MKKLQLLMLMFFAGITLASAQEKSFIVNKNFEKTINLVSDFQSTIMKDEGGLDAAMGNGSFNTSLVLRKEKYAAGSANNYLLVQYKGEKKEAVLSSTWDLTIKKIDANKSKVTLSLTKVAPEDEFKSRVDSSKTISSGKLEKQLKDYLISKK